MNLFLNHCIFGFSIQLSRYDSDNPRVYADVGMTGVAIDSVEDMKVVKLKNILLFSIAFS